MAYDHRYVYLCYGRSPQTPMELRYSIESLLPEICGDASRIAIFTDRPDDFRDLGVATLDVSGEVAATPREYRHTLKPLILARALRHFAGACVLLDTDSFVRPGFDARVAAALAKGAAMNDFVREEAYADFGPFETELPHLGHYALHDPGSRMLNSGLVAARFEHLPLIEDAVVLIERLWTGGLTRHDIEQFAIAEAFRLGGVEVALINREFEHYFPRWSKRYFRRELRRRKPGETVAFSKARVRLFKGKSLLRMGWRNLRRRLSR